MSESKDIVVTLTQQQGYAFVVDFGESLPELLTDEPAPLGEGAGPNPSRLMLAAIANCLAASLTFALSKFHNKPGPITAVIRAALARSDGGRWRIPRASVELQLSEAGDTHQHIERILKQFEEFCVVTQSVRDGIDVDVCVRDADGAVLHDSKSS